MPMAAGTFLASAVLDSSCSDEFLRMPSLFYRPYCMVRIGVICSCPGVNGMLKMLFVNVISRHGELIALQMECSMILKTSLNRWRQVSVSLSSKSMRSNPVCIMHIFLRTQGALIEHSETRNLGRFLGSCISQRTQSSCNKHYEMSLQRASVALRNVGLWCH